MEQKTIRVVGTALIITSIIQFTALELLKKFSPESLILKDEKGNQLFRIGVGITAELSKFGVVFNSANAEGYAQATLMLPNGIEDVKQFVVDNFGQTITALQNFEPVVLAHYDATAAAFNAVKESITIE